MADATLRAVISAQDNASGVIGKVSSALEGMQKKLQPAADASKKVALGLAGFAIAAGGFAAKGIQVAGQLESMRQGFVSLLGSAEAADKTMARIKQEAARTPFELPGLTSATQALALVTKDGDKSIDVLLNVGKALATAGKGQAELDRIIANLQQIALTGKITEMDIRQFGMNGVNILELLADSYGVTTAEASEMVKNSKDAFGDLTKAFEKAGGEGGKFADGFTNQAGTFNQLWSNLSDTITIALSDFVKSTGIFDAVKDAVGRLIEVLPTLLEKVEKTIKFFNEHRELLAIVAGIILGALTPAILAAAVALGIMAIALAPYVIGGAIIGGVVAGILWIIKHWEDIKAKATEIWDAIKNYLSGVWESIKQSIVNVWTGIKDWIIGTWNGLSDSAKGWLLLLGNIMTGGMLYVAMYIYKHWDDIKAKTIEVWDAIKGFLSGVWNAILAVITPPLTAVANFIKSKWDEIRNATTSAWNGIKGFFGEVWEGIKSTFGNAIDWILRKLSPLINAIDTVKKGIGGAVSGVGNFLKNNLTPRAFGGAVDPNRSFLVGERGPEIFTPSNYGSITRNSQIGSGGGITVNVYGDVSGQELIEKVKRGIMSELKMNTQL